LAIVVSVDYGERILDKAARPQRTVESRLLNFGPILGSLAHPINQNDLPTIELVPVGPRMSGHCANIGRQNQHNLFRKSLVRRKQAVPLRSLTEYLPGSRRPDQQQASNETGQVFPWQAKPGKRHRRSPNQVSPEQLWDTHQERIRDYEDASELEVYGNGLGRPLF
jgi:hypothetical protein